MNVHARKMSVVAALLVGVAVWLWRASAVAPPPRAPATSPDGAREPAAPRPGETPAATVAPGGWVGSYALQATTRWEGLAPDGGATAAELRWRAQWRVAELRAAPSWLGVRAIVESWQANEAMVGATGLGPEARAAVGEPLAIRVDEIGQVVEVRCARQTPAPVCALLAGVVHLQQFVRPKDAVGASWQVDERDLTGTHAARYQAADGDRVKKHWTGAAAHPDAESTPGLTLTASAEFSLQRGELVAVRSEQTGEWRPVPAASQPQARFRLTLALQRGPAVRDTWLAGLDPEALVPFDPEAGAANLAQPPADAPGAVATLETLPADVAHDTRAALRERVARGLTDDPANLALVRDKLVSGTLSEVAERTLLEALVGSPAGHAVLTAIIADRALADSLRDRALMAAILLPNPSQATVRGLLAAMEAEPARASAVAVVVGAAARELSGRGSPEAPALVASLVAAARPHRGGRDAPKPTLFDECNWLAALGNSGAPEALPAILAALADPRDVIRVSAAHALRFQDPVATEEAMTLAMADDVDIGVRQALLHAARWQGPKERATFVEKALLFDPSKAVRLEAAFTMASWSVTLPGLRQALAKALAAEKDEDVQESLRNYLTPGRLGNYATQATSTH